MGASSIIVQSVHGALTRLNRLQTATTSALTLRATTSAVQKPEAHSWSPLSQAPDPNFGSKLAHTPQIPALSPPPIETAQYSTTVEENGAYEVVIDAMITDGVSDDPTLGVNFTLAPQS